MSIIFVKWQFILCVKINDIYHPVETCDDGIKNGKENDVDCGGHCKTDCCTDGKRNWDEEDIDCGGGCPVACCSNGKQNGDETAIDCGGSCPACPGMK